MANFSLLAKLGLDSKGFQKGLSKAKSGVSRFGKSVLNASNKLAKMGLGAAAAGFALLSKNAIALGSELSDIAANTGFATKEFQVFRGALIDAGGSTTSMEKAIVAMQKAVVQGSEGLTTYIRGFDRLGLNIDDIKAMKPEDQFVAIGKAIAGAENQQEALTSAVEIFGQRNAGRLIEVFKRLDSEGYGKMAKDIEKTYGIMDAETQKALDKAADTIERFKNKATIRVGELIAGEADGAALKILGLSVAKAGSKIGIGLINGILEAVRIAREAFGAFADFFYNQMATTAGLIGNLLKMEFFNAVNEMIIALNKIPKVNIDLIDTKDIADKLGEGLDKGSKSFYEHFQDRMDQGFTPKLEYDPGSFYDEEIDRQKSILEASRKAASEIEGAGGDTPSDPPNPDGDPPVDPPADPPADPDGEVPNPDGEETDEEKRAKDLENKEKQINDMKLEAMRAQEAGDKEAEDSLNKRIELGQRMIDIMKSHDVSQEEALRLASGQINRENMPDPSEEEPQRKSDLRGHDLKKAANIAGSKDGIRFEKLGGGGFQQFVNGRKGDVFTEEQMQAGLQKQIDKDGTEGLLEKINATLEGKFVSQ
tara:strand:+ start:536 stop:2317 length:1782 start_codon:yes stop_codon:yes gene_type:complete